jgi:hypothetical protein
MNTNVKRWKDVCLYSDINEQFFAEFPCLLYEWLKRQTATNTTLRLQEPLVWDQFTIDKMNWITSGLDPLISIFLR